MRAALPRFLLMAAFISGVAVVDGVAKPAVTVDRQPVSVSRSAGDDCADPLLIATLPYSDLGQTTCGRGNDHDATCLGYYDGGEDLVYRLDLASPTIVTVTFDPRGTL
jgi:hypothetical protein